MRQADFDKRTFIERVSLAAREPVYSAALAWLLDEQSPLSLHDRLAIVGALSGEDASGGQEIIAKTEWHDVDVLLKVERVGRPLYVAIENKIKAVEQRTQLVAYDRHLGELDGTVKKVFLTVNGERPRMGVGWVAASYAVIRDALRAQPSLGNPYIDDLRGTIERLVSVADAARAHDGLAAATAFGDASEASDISLYVKDMRLEKLVQRIWMTDLAGSLDVRHPWQTAIDETHGQALLNVQALLQSPPRYLVGMQLQARTLKAFCAPHPYPKRASAEQHRTVESILETMRSALVLGAQARPSAGAKRGFRSFSIRVDLPPGRNRDKWAAVLRPQIRRLVAALPSVLPVESQVVPFPDDSE